MRKMKIKFISLYEGKFFFKCLLGPMAIIMRRQITQWAVGFEFVPYGIVLFLGPLSFGFVHARRNLKAGQKD